MILILLFSIEMACVAAVCPTRNASAYSSCDDREVSTHFTLYADKGFTTGGPVAYELLASYPTFSECSVSCADDNYCTFFDYNCQTGACILFKDLKNRGNAVNQLVVANGHISAIYDSYILQASAFSSCDDRDVSTHFTLYVDKKFKIGGRVAYESLAIYPTFSECSISCADDNYCTFFDYNCQTGACILFKDLNNGGIAANQLVVANGHISAIYA
jgi:hypothetical protein